MNEKYRLKELKIEVTYRCNLACIHCSSDASPICEVEMTEEQCIGIINQAKDLGVNEIVFSGGEPLIWEGLDNSIYTTVKNGSSVTIFTSGNIPNIEPRIYQLKDLGASKIVFSVFGSDSLSHEQVTRQNGSFNRTIEATNIAIKAGFQTEFHFVPLSFNYMELTKVAHLAQKLKVNRISVLRFVPQGRGYLLRDYALNKEQNLKLKKLILELRNSGFDIRTGSPYNFLMLNDKPRCAAGLDRLIIGPDLRIYPCDAFKQIMAEEIVHTLDFSTLDGFTLSSCWSLSPFLNATREYLESAFEEPCDACVWIDKCLSGCLAQKVIQTGEFMKVPDPMCIIKHGSKITND